MADDVVLKLVADNTSAVKGIREIQAETQKLTDNIKKLEKQQNDLFKTQEKGFSDINKLKQYEKQMSSITDEIKKNNDALKDLNKTEKTSETQTESAVKSIGKWAAGLGLITGVLNELKKSFLDTVTGINLITTAQEVWTQMTYNVVTANNTLNTSLASSIAIAKQINELRKTDRLDLVEKAKLQKNYNELYFAASDRTKTDIVRIGLLNQAQLAHEVIMGKEIANLETQRAIVVQQLVNRPKSNKLLDEEARLTAAIVTAQDKMLSGTIRLEGLRTGLIQEGNEREIAALKRIKEEREKAVEDEEKLEERRTILSQQHATKLSVWLQGENEEKRKKRDEDLEAEITYWEILQATTANAMEVIGDSLDEYEKRKAEADQEAKEAELERLKSIEQAKYDFMQSALYDMESLVGSSSQIMLGIFNNRLNSEIASIDAAAKIKLEFAKGDIEETMRIQTEAEEKKLKVQQEYTEKARKMEIASIAVSKAIAIAEIIIRTAIANAKAVAASPLTAGMPWVAINNVQAGISIASVVAAAAAAIIATKGKSFAKGGWTGEGGEKDETGERVAGVVHEKEFVTKKGPASKYREVLEAINRDDKASIFNAFNRIEPELLGSTTNVTVENSGPNNRLDRINNQLSQLNQNLSPRRQSREEVTTDGANTIIRKGSNVRTIKR